MDNRLTPEQENTIIEDALKNYPLAPMPRSITSNVMTRVQKDIRPRLVTWNDLALSMVVALCIGALLFAVQSLPPLMLARLRIQGILLHQDILVNARWLIPTAWFGLAVFVSVLILPALYKMATDNGR